jgi:hypothetical protein
MNSKAFYIVITRLLIASQQYFKTIVGHNTFPVMAWSIQPVHSDIGGMAGQFSIAINGAQSARFL